MMLPIGSQLDQQIPALLEPPMATAHCPTRPSDVDAIEQGGASQDSIQRRIVWYSLPLGKMIQLYTLVAMNTLLHLNNRSSHQHNSQE